MNAISSRLVPLASALGRRTQAVLCVCFVLLVACSALTVANAVFGIGGRALQHPIRDWVSSAIYILVAAIVAMRAIYGAQKRVAWGLIAIGVSMYGLGQLLWSLWLEHVQNVPIPSICDALWLALYPLSYIGIIGLARTRGQRQPAGAWLDGLIAGGALAAVGAALLNNVLASVKGSPLEAATGLAFPIGDLLLAALVVGVLVVRGWRLDRTWLLAGAFLLLAIADIMYLAQIASGSSSPSPLTNLAYVVAFAVLAFAAWQPHGNPPARRPHRWSVLLIPAGCTITVLGLLIYDHVQRLNSLALGFVIVTLIGAAGRTGIAFRDLRSLAEARREAGTDDLTQLPNRRLFRRRVTDALRAATIADGSLAVAIIDLDNFKDLNDTLGHQAGDALLCRVGPRLRLALRSTDTVARLGGDEFAVLLDPAPDTVGIIKVAEKVLHALREPFDVQGIALRLTASIGIAGFPSDATDSDELIQRADIAMYQAKSAGDRYAFYARELDTNSRERLALAGDLAAALEDGGIEVHFQPKAITSSHEIVGVEALVRWRRADGSLLAPIHFIGVAEHAGLSRTLTRKVLELALAQLEVWRRAGHPLHVAINTTVADLLDAAFPAEIATALASHGLPPEALILEVTETSVLSDPGRIRDVLGQLGELGVKLSLDDFGTGYSSLTHLRMLPVGEVKLDRSFVAGMCNDLTDWAIVHATVELAHRLGIEVVAEGVEDERTWEALDTLGCEYVQGYALSRPVPATELSALLDTQANGDGDGAIAGAGPSPWHGRGD